MKKYRREKNPLEKKDHFFGNYNDSPSSKHALRRYLGEIYESILIITEAKELMIRTLEKIASSTGIDIEKELEYMQNK